MGNIISNIDLFSHLKCNECQEVLDHKSDYGIPYLAYVIGKGKYNKKYYCMNCLNELMEKNR